MLTSRLKGGVLTCLENYGQPKEVKEWSYGGEQDVEDGEVRQERDQDKTEQYHGSVLVHEDYEAVQGTGQEGEDHLRAVERGDRDQVEDEEQSVREGDHDHEYEQVAAPVLEWW